MTSEGIETTVLPPGTMDATLRYLFPSPDPYGDNPADWIRDRLGGHVWSRQEEICNSVVQNRYTAVKACHGPGKSWIASRIGAWWLNVHDLGDAFLVSSAPSWPQVQAILWREMRRAHRVGKLPGRITLDCHWYMGEGKSNEELIAMGRKPADYGVARIHAGPRARPRRRPCRLRYPSPDRRAARFRSRSLRCPKPRRQPG